MHLCTCFLDASSHPYKLVCLSVGQSIGRSVCRSVCHHFVLAYLLVTQGGSGRLCTIQFQIQNSIITNFVSKAQSRPIDASSEPPRVTLSHSESLKSYQGSCRAVRSRSELLRVTPEQSGNGPTDRPTDGRTDGPTK